MCQFSQNDRTFQLNIRIGFDPLEMAGRRNLLDVYRHSCETWPQLLVNALLMNRFTASINVLVS